MRRSKKPLLIILALVVLGSVAAWTADRQLKSRHHPGLRTFLKQWVVNYPKGFRVDPERLVITVEPADLDRITGVVERARERGVIIPEDNLYVPARFEHEGRHFKGRIRIKGKLTDHIQGRKWSFRVIASKDGGFLGMKRFSLQHPGTRNYLTDWFYHRIMAGEGHVALRYLFTEVEFNGEDLGIYALEEHFGPELLEHNARLPGPLVRFDPGLYWTHRLNVMEGIHYNEAFAEYQVSPLDAFGTKKLMADDAGRTHFQRAVGMIDAYRRGKLAASEVFDVDRVAARQAVLDLLGGWRSVDWSDVKFHFDPVSQRLEPISYEAASGWPIDRLIGAYRHVGPWEEGDEVHDALFKDPALFAAYVQHLERISRKEWLDSVFQAIGPALDTASAVLYREFPYKELDRSVYYRNQQVIRRLLDVPKPFHAYLQRMEGDTVVLAVLPIESLPMHVMALEIKGGTSLPVSGRDIVPSRPEGRMGDPVHLRFILPEGMDSLETKGLNVRCSVLGSARSREVEVFPHPLLEEGDLAALHVRKTPNHRSFPFIHTDESLREIVIEPGAWMLDRDLVLPAGYTVHARSPLVLELREGASIISRSPLKWKGDEDRHIELRALSGTGSRLLVLEAGSQSVLDHVRFLGLEGEPGPVREPGVRFHLSPLRAKGCTFSSAPHADALHVSMALTELLACTFLGGRDQLVSDFAELVLRATKFQGASDDAITLRGGRADIAGLQADEITGIAVKAAKHAQVELRDPRIRSADKGIKAEEGARVTIKGGSISGTTIAIEAAKDALRYGPVRIDVQGTRLEGNATDHQVRAGSTIMHDGIEVGESKTATGT